MSELVLTDQERARAGARLVTLLDRYERDLPGSRVLPEPDRAQLATLLADSVPEKGIGVDGLFDRIEDVILPNSTTVAHSRFLAYVLGPPNGVAAYAEAVAATINQNCNFWQLSPAASVVERSVLEWLTSIVGFPSTAKGILTGGGSLATLQALATALEDRVPGFRRTGLQQSAHPLVVYTSVEAHRSVDKAAAILGIGLDHIRHIAVDDQNRMDVAALSAAIDADREAGLRPWCVVATCGTVATGSVDPMDAIADLCQEQELWLHVDGAYGGLFLLCEEMRDLMGGAARADSISLDPHKLLFAPLEAGCLLVRDGTTLRAAYAFESSYLTVTEDPLMTDYMDYGPQLSRNFKALKVWSALQAFGVDAFRAATRRTLELSQQFARGIEATAGLTLLAPVTLTAICFAVEGASHDEHTELLETLAADNTALLGPVMINGRHGIRACITNHRTTTEDIDLILARLREPNLLRR
ncbi:pyridoxal phosphate-dependent decarboxylase family protein [Amycolatopsis jiangsuensis]|uniref:Glutamate/tyrosine decarboxylase-like PLP-dependent enzyme n=1 Tax=Amycolatopsis jiangsuensis TaxID=1181879 RepID=A0A840J6P0_9PSEU|nr:aminotransferase class I/II-fold pyridoxal phosphate-dependent enzyme [Amycolatopsis jiangsuensis]MBB4689265.1 glutamate/tyrosine decarboxylase-like PLP-dependent enzyme [Amycolatopsis jiangsuensis]